MSSEDPYVDRSDSNLMYIQNGVHYWWNSEYQCFIPDPWDMPNEKEEDDGFDW